MKKQVFFNEDPNHFVFERIRSGKTKLTKKDLTDFIDQYKNTSVTDFLVTLNAGNCWYPSKKTDNVIDKYKALVAKDPSAEGLRLSWGAKLMAETYESGLEVHKIWIERLREDGINPWVSIRMNDIHGAAEPGNILNSRLTDEHPEYCRTPYRKPEGYYDFALDYMQEEVRKYYMDIIEEALDTFDVYGIELDFMREIYSVCIGREYEALEVINEFMREANRKINAAEKKYGHKIKRAVRVPATPEIAVRLGFDVFTWVREELVDYITVTSRWATIDDNMPIDIWKNTFEGKNVQILAGLEAMSIAYHRTPRVYRIISLEVTLGACAAYLDMGADGIYLFNYMDALIPYDDRDKDCILNRGRDTLYKIAGDREAIDKSERRNVVTFNDVGAIGTSAQKQLPVSFGERSYSHLRIPTGNIPKNCSVKFIMGINGEVDRDTLTVFANAKKCKPLGNLPSRYPQYEDMEYYAFEIENDGNLPPVTVVELSAEKGRGMAHWAEIQIVPESV